MTWLVTWVALVARHPWRVLTVVAALTALFGWIASTTFKINSNLNDLVHQSATWRDDFDVFQAKFPALTDTAFVVVSGTSFERVENTALAIEARLLARPDAFSEVYSPSNDVFFKDHALLFADLDDLEKMIDRLAQAQPVLTRVAEDPSLRSVLGLVRDGLENEPGIGTYRILRLLADSAESVVRGGSGRVLWADEFFGNDGEERFRLIFLKGFADFGATLPNSVILSNLRSEISRIDIPIGVDVAITGEVALAHEEISAALDGVQIAGLVSIALLTLVLGFGVRSVKIVVSTFAMLAVGIVWTTAFAMLTVGEFNTLSILFLVMFFGLGVDFAIHFSLCYTEALATQDAGDAQALGASAGSVGHAIVLCTITTAIGFLGFLPTDYSGLADLGVISAGGMVIACALTFTLLPAIYMVWPRRSRSARHVGLPSGDRIVRGLVHRRGHVLGVVTVATAAAAIIASQAYFDYSVLALRDPESESMTTLKRLQNAEIITDYALSVLTSDVGATRELRGLEALTTVGAVITPFDYVPTEQADKRMVLEDAQAILWSAIEPQRVAIAPSDDELATEIAALASNLATHRWPDATPDASAQRLQAAMIEIDTPGERASWQTGFVDGLVAQLDWLRMALLVDEVTFENLPAPLKKRLVSAAGVYHSVILPFHDITDVESLTQFIDEVRSRVPVATGRPVVEWGVGGIMVRSFVEALVFAIVAIGLVLLVALRGVVDTVLVLMPLGLAAVFTIATAVLVGAPLNMANILVLPLIFGLGVDNGIHVVERYRRMRTVADLMHSSTPRAVMLSTLTTIGTFASLMTSAHKGTASIGFLLTVSIAFLLLFTVFLLPVLLSFLRKGHDPV